VCWEGGGEVKGFMTLGLVEQAIGQYDLPPGIRAQFISRSENETYKLQVPSGEAWAMRLQRPGYQSRNALGSELAWLSALRADGVMATPVPVAGRNGEWVQEVEGRHVVLFRWQLGCTPYIGMDLRRPIRDLGAIAARMHAHSRAWRKPQNFERFTWDFEAALGERARWGHWSHGLGIDPGRCDLFTRAADLVRKRLAQYGAGPDRFGLAHCDLRLDNLLLNGEEVKLIDFDDCGSSWYMYEAATVVSFYEHLPQANAMIEQWLEGYRTVAAVSKEEEEEIPTFVMLRRLMLVGWIGSHPQADLARALGAGFTEQTMGLCAAYLGRMG
jgi:Ser/Thr protein kinase RdoA (MazF antagonist)